MKEYLAILDSDRAYADELARSLNKIGHFPFRAEAFGGKEAFLSFLQENPVSILMLQKELEDEDLAHAHVGQVLYLTDVRGYSSVDAVPAVFKYQPVFKLEEEIMRLQHCITEAGTDELQGVSRTSFIGVQSPVGRCLKTSFALVLGVLLSQTSAVLYVSLEPFSGLQAWFEEHFDSDLSDLLFACEVQGKAFQASGYLKEFHGLRFVPPVRMAEDILRSDPAAVCRAVQETARQEHFDVVILDLGCDFRLTEAFLPHLQKLYVPTVRMSQQTEKTEAFLQWTERIRPDIERITETVVLPVIRTFNTGRGYLEQLIWSELGDQVRSLLGEHV